MAVKNLERRNVQLLPSQWERLDALAKQRGHSTAALIRDAVDQYLNREHPMRTTRQQDLEQIALIIREYPWHHDFENAAGFAAKQNADAGWSFEVRYDGQEKEHWTRVEGMRLSEADLAAAVALAAAL